MQNKSTYPVLMQGIQKDIDIFVKVYTDAKSVTGYSDGTLSFKCSQNAFLIERVKRGVVAPATMSRIMINLNALIRSTNEKMDAGLL